MTNAWAATGADSAGWHSTLQTYDWKGRPLETTNTDGTTKKASYGGCGCAGGAVVTLTDEGTLVDIDPGSAINNVPKKRQQKIYSDALGRTVKTEVLNWDGTGPFGTGDDSTVYSTTASTYNARDQVTLVRQYQGPDTSGVHQDTTLTYDDYGRLQTKHTPEQDANTVTSYDYYDDDALKKVTDARGTSSSFTYKDRPLVETVTYAAPAGITPTAPVTFGYDEAGNRNLMIDGLGTVVYEYDTLSRMRSETRTFSDPNNSAINGVIRTLSYDYNLAGELKQVTDPFGAVINYGFDVTGRPNNITGSGYGSVTQFVSNMQYRAFGALKSESYGNGSQFNLSANYNGRQQIVSFAIRRANGATLMADSYQFYADGRARFTDNQDETLDRSYSYDHSGRMTEAYSGSEARNFINGTQGGTATGSYRQSFQYDALSHTTQQVNRFWSETKTTTNTIINDRRQGWSYDANGELSHDGTTTYVRDAAGHIVQKDGVPFHDSSQFDGNGLMVYNRYTSPCTTPFVTRTYYLRSTALRGLAVAELNVSGEKTKGNVYAGQRKIAEATGSTVSWVHSDPVTGSRADSDNNGVFEALAEFSADGINLGFEDPTASEPPISPKLKTEFPMLAITAGCTGTACPPTCYVEGFKFECGTIDALKGIGAAEDCPDNNCGPRRGHDKDGNPIIVPLKTNPNNGQIGFWPNGYDHTGVTTDALGNPIRLSSDSRSVPGVGTPIYGRFGVSTQVDKDGNPIDPSEWEYSVTGYTMSLALGMNLLPQNPGQTPRDTRSSNQKACDDKIAGIFGGPGAVAATVAEPTTLLSDNVNRNPSATYDHLAGGGVFHLYTNAQGTEATVGLYRPPGGRLVSGGEYDNHGDTENYFRYSYTKGPLKGVTLSFVHVGGTHGGEVGGKYLGSFPGEPLRVGNIGGPGGEGFGYNHTHVKVFYNGKLTDPRKIFCKGLGF